MIAHPFSSSRYARHAFRREAENWCAAGKQLDLWWRDDDARRPSRALARLLQLAERHQVPLTLAVIPDEDLDPLAAYLADHHHVTTIQHGVDHVNRSAQPCLPAEFSAHHPVDEIQALLKGARQRFKAMARHWDILAPPWNRAPRNVIAAAAGAGFIGVSAFGEALRRGTSGPARIDTHLDPLRWNDGAKFRGSASFYFRLMRLMRERRLAGNWREPIGLLTHHLQHDAEAWDFIEALLAELRGLGAIRWRAIGDLVGSVSFETAPPRHRAPFNSETVSALAAASALGR